MTITPALEISSLTQRHFIMGMHGLYPGRRWQGKDGILTAIEAMGGLQVDPLNVVARSHDIVLWGRVQNYQVDNLDSLLYQERKLFDWGGTVLIYPMHELPYWRVIMERRKQSPRYLKFLDGHEQVLRDVLEVVRERGPVGSADLKGKTVREGSFRTGKDTGQALYHLWLTGELMTHSRRGFQRVYDLFERVAPVDVQHTASVDEDERHFMRTVWASYGIVTLRGFRSVFQGTVERPVSNTEAEDHLNKLLGEGFITPVTITGRKDPYFIRSEELPLLETLHQGGIPGDWQPINSSTAEEVNFLAPLDLVSTRGRAKVLFDFEYVWEVYKPAEKRRWGYYTLPVLYRDSLVARLDPKLDRTSNTLQIKGLWLEPDIETDDDDFSAAMTRGLHNFAGFVGAQQIDVSAVQPDSLRTWAEALVME